MTTLSLKNNVTFSMENNEILVLTVLSKLSSSFMNNGITGRANFKNRNYIKLLEMEYRTELNCNRFERSRKTSFKT